MKKIKLSNQEKTLLILLKLSSGTKKNLKFEDVVVTLFKKFPRDFNLKGYEQYPDAEAIRKPLYQFKKQGILQIRNMILSLTDKGIDIATKIKEKSSKKIITQNSENKLDRYVEKEISRIQNSGSYNKYFKDRDNIFDTEFFDYLGISVKSDKNEFKGRLSTLSEVVKSIEKLNDAHFKKIVEFHKFMINKFRNIINYKLEN